MNLIKCLSLVGFCVVAVASVDLAGAENAQPQNCRTIGITNHCSHQIYVYFNKEDARKSCNMRQLIPRSWDVQTLYLPSLEDCKIYLTDGHGKYHSIPVSVRMKSLYVSGNLSGTDACDQVYIRADY